MEIVLVTILKLLITCLLVLIYRYKKEGENIRKLLVIIAVLCLCLARGKETFAENNAVTSLDGLIKFTTIDTEAKSSIRWKTVGFTITRQPCTKGGSNNGGNPRKMKFAMIMLEESWKKERESKESIVVDFIIPKNQVSQALLKAGFSDIKDNDTLYLHGIFQVMHKEKDYGPKLYDLPSITKAENWANPEDFEDRFDIKVTYHAPAEPISIQYKTSSGDIIETKDYPETKWEKPGTQVDATLEEEKEYQGKKYRLYKSYVKYYGLQKPIQDTGKSLLKGDSIKEVKQRSIRQRVGGIQFVGILKQEKEKPKEKEDVREKEIDEIEAIGEIDADSKENPKFHVEDGIPSSERVFIKISTNQELFTYALRKKVLNKTIPITIKKGYHLTWEKKSKLGHVPEKHSTYKTITKTYEVKKTCVYWEIENVEYYVIRNAVIENEVLPGKKQLIVPKNYKYSKPTYKNYVEEEHIDETSINKNLILSEETIQGGSSCPDIPNENFQTFAIKEVEKIKVRNDKLLHNEVLILNDEWTKGEIQEPTNYNLSSKKIDDDVLCLEHIQIPAELANGEYESFGSITYQEILSFGGKKEDIVAPLDEVNSVVVHTPVICNAYIQDAERYCQMLYPSLTRKQLVLDRTFQIGITNIGMHRPIKGYEMLNCDKYTRINRVRLPFEVYQGNQLRSAYEWIELSEKEEFYLPVWVEEGEYTIECQSIAINAREGENGTEYVANLSTENYIAIDEIDVQISGRLYGLKLYDVSDYPMWESVFRMPNSLKRTGTIYPVGVNDQNGIRKKIEYTVPLLNGSHPIYKECGTQKTGYVTRFYLDTVGTMYGDKDFVQITPSFYYVDKEGKNRKKVDVYYAETIQENKQVLVKVGSEMDLRNIKYQNLSNPYVQAPMTEMLEKVDLTGKTFSDLFEKSDKMYTFHHILLNEHFRTYVGKNFIFNESILSKEKKTKICFAAQRWYGEYYLPSEIHLVAEGVDLGEYEKTHGAFRFDEPIWKNDGYLIVNFDIVYIL